MKWLSRFIVFAVASSGPGVAAQDVPSQARADLAPTGKLMDRIFKPPFSMAGVISQDRESCQFFSA
jgi:hypothetical protein